jgi:Uma2 family endonuclease
MKEVTDTGDPGTTSPFLGLAPYLKCRDDSNSNMSHPATTPSRLPAPAKWSVEEYHQMTAVGLLQNRHVELLNGDIVEMSPVGSLHEGRGDNVADYLRERLGRSARVRENKAVTLSSSSEPEPDIAVVEYRDYTDHHPYPENIFLLIEIANSSLDYDLQVKRPIYAQAAIQEYWVMDVSGQKLHVFTGVDEADYQSERIFDLTSDQSLSMQAFPDIELSLAQMQQLRG